MPRETRRSSRRGQLHHAQDPIDPKMAGQTAALARAPAPDQFVMASEGLPPDSKVALQNEGVPQAVIRGVEPHITTGRCSFEVTEIFLVSNKFQMGTIKRACDVQSVVRRAIIQNEELELSIRLYVFRKQTCNTEQ